MKNVIPKAVVRPALILAVITAMFAAVCVRIAYIICDPTVLSVYASEKEVRLGETRGYIYDVNGDPMVNRTQIDTAVLITTPVTVKAFEKATGYKLETPSGLLVTRETPVAIEESDLAVNVPLIQRYDDSDSCVHLIGYTDADGRGVCGIEKSFDRILAKADGSIGIRYACDAFGKALLGEKIDIINRNYDSPAGIILTIDDKIQRTAEYVMRTSGIKKGACVIMDVHTGEIRACVSLPAYKVSELDSALRDADAPFLNRALNAYPVGSVFKPFVAAAAIENGICVNGDYECVGRTDVGGTIFHCYKRKSHGKMQLNEAICNSCNCFFIDIGLKLGAEKMIDTCSLFGFGQADRLTADLVSSAGNLPTADKLSTPAAVANLSFGQGELLATPLQLCAAYAVLASGGIRREPFLTKYLVDDNGERYAFYSPKESYRVLDEGVCGVVNESLRLNMIDGTGAAGAPQRVSSAGKTATAQTGEYDSTGNERLCTWFCGFFPFEDPEYAVCIFNEDGETGDCTPLFGQIADRIADLS